MKARPLTVTAFVVGIALPALLVPGGTRPTAVQLKPSAPVASAPNFAPDHAQVTAALQSTPPMFIENVGQFDERACFQVGGGGRTIWLAEEALWISIFEQESEGAEKSGRDASAPTPPHRYSSAQEGRQPQTGLRRRQPQPTPSLVPTCSNTLRYSTTVSVCIRVSAMSVQPNSRNIASRPLNLWSTKMGQYQIRTESGV